MKLFIVLALASVALASPLVQSVVMPEAPLPELEDMPYVPMFEPVAIKPLFVPQEIIAALKLAEEQVPADAEAVFEAMEQAGEADVVHVVENVVYENDADPIAAMEDVALAGVEEIPADAVHFVDVAENIESEVAQEEVAAPAVEEIPADAVNFVEVAENIESEVAPAVEDVVDVVDYVVYENDADHFAEEEAVVAAAEEIPADAVNFVDVAENMEYNEDAEMQMNAEEILPEAVHFVDNAENIEAAAGDVEELSAVKVVEVAPVAENDYPRYPGKIYENPMLRQMLK